MRGVLPARFLSKAVVVVFVMIKVARRIGLTVLRRPLEFWRSIAGTAIMFQAVLLCRTRPSSFIFEAKVE